MRQAVSDGQAIRVLFDDDEDEVRRVMRAIDEGTIAETRQQMAFEEDERND